MRDAKGPAYVTLQDYLRVVRRGKWLILAVALVFAGAAVALSLSREKTYTAQAAISFRDVSGDFTLVGQPGFTDLPPQQRAAADASLVTQPAVAKAVQRRLHTSLPPATLQAAVGSAVESLTNLVDVNATWGSPQFAGRLANAFAEETANFETLRTKQQLKEAITSLKRSLRNARQDPASRSLIRQRLVELETVRTVTQPATVVRHAGTPTAASGLGTIRSGVLGALVGLAFGLLAAFGRDLLDRRLRGPSDIHAELGLPVLGRISEDALGHGALAINGQGKVPDADFEAIRVLRTNLQFLEPGEPVRSILVTSGLPEEGKSTIAASLASSVAVAGKRTLLVECDLRRPSLAGRLGLRAGPGLRDYLYGNATPQEILQTVELKNPHGGNGKKADPPTLVCITAGGHTPDAAELLTTQRFRDFLDHVTEAYDLVVLDTSPLLSVVDPLELIPLVDGVLLCVRLSQTTRDEARATKAALSHLPERPTGIVVTGIRPGDTETYGYYTYGYGA